MRLRFCFVFHSRKPRRSSRSISPIRTIEPADGRYTRTGFLRTKRRVFSTGFVNSKPRLLRPSLRGGRQKEALEPLEVILREHPVGEITQLHARIVHD